MVAREQAHAPVPDAVGVQPRADLPIHMVYWCATPTNVMKESGTTIAEARGYELARGCGYYASEGAFWAGGFGIAALYLTVVSVWLSVAREWEGWWGLMLVAVPLIVCWWLVAPLMALAAIPLSVAGIAGSVRAFLKYRERRARRLAQQAAERRKELEPYERQLDELLTRGDR